MFQYNYPQFEKKRLLRIHMLEQMRDYPENIVQLSFQDYKDGIVKGCNISWDSGQLSVGPGMVLYEGRLYCMKQTLSIPCPNEDRLRFLKIKFEKLKHQADGIYGNSNVILDGSEADPACEIELCRFRLQQGARLRCTHESFEDFSTEYDTTNLIHAPYAAEGESTISPVIVKAFAKEMIERQVGDVMDTMTAMNILSASGHLPAEYLKSYVFMKSGIKANSNAELYRALLRILCERNGEQGYQAQEKRNTRSIMLL